MTHGPGHGNLLATPSAATITFTLKVSAHKVPNTGSYGDEVNAFGNGFDVFRQHYWAGAVVVGWTATRGDPATNFIRISRGPGVWQFEATRAGGIATGLCVSDPGGGWPDPAGPDGLLITVCNSGPWQQFRVLTAEPSELRDVATGLVVWPDGTGAQLRGSVTPIGGVSNRYTWMDNAKLPLSAGICRQFLTSPALCASNGVGRLCPYPLPRSGRLAVRPGYPRAARVRGRHPGRPRHAPPECRGLTLAPRQSPEAPMLAIVAFVCGVVAAILKLTGQHLDAVTWLLIIGLIAVSAEVLWGWHRGGYYGRRTVP